ncbi:MAG: alpha-2-macroglobulin [Magnetococcales bacterium]|nr:alpha-2-macroglobulin [Magnetococcales bacterium]
MKKVRQVKARFALPMVSFGDPRLEDPFAIDCPEAGKGRWVDSHNWVYDFARDLPGGIRCTFTASPNLHTLAGAPVTGNNRFSFSTGGPTILRSLPGFRNMVDEEQTFILFLDAQADEASVSKNMTCDVAGMGEKIGVRVLQGKERTEVLQKHPDLQNGRLQRQLSRPGGAASTVSPTKTNTAVKQTPTLSNWDAGRITVVQCLRRFPNNAEVGLVWSAGIRALSGVEGSQPQRIPFRAREAFAARFSCERPNKDAHCFPILPMQLRLTHPIVVADARQIRLKGEDGHLYPATLGRDDDSDEESDGSRPEEDHIPGKSPWISHLTFPGPFPESSTFTLEIPQGIKDDSGRSLTNQASFPLTVKSGPFPALAKFPAPFGIIEAKGDAALPVTLRNLEAILPLDATHPGSWATTEPTDKPDALGKGDKTDTMDLPTTLVAEWWSKVQKQQEQQPVEVRGRRLRLANPVEFIPWMKQIRDVQESVTEWQDDKPVIKQRPGEISVFAHLEPARLQQLETFTLPKPGGSKTFEVIGIPLPGPGLYVVELASDRLGTELHGEKKPYYVQSAVLVTNLSAHFKQGGSNALVWVTTLDEGKPVGDAEVTVGDCQGHVHFTGRTNAQGIVILAKPLPPLNTLPKCPNNGYFEQNYLVTARSGDDVTFLLSSWNEGISPYNFQIPYESWRSEPDSILTTVFDRTLLRAGETLAMKHFARQATDGGIALQKTVDLPEKALIRHLGSEQEYTLPLHWDARQVAENRWSIPQSAKHGQYEVIMVSSKAKGAGQHSSGSFRVEAFRVPTMKASVTPLQAEAINPSQVELDLHAGYLSGGAAGHMPVKLRGLLQPKVMQFAPFEDVVFANGRMAEGPVTRHPNRSHDSEEDADNPNDDTPEGEKSRPLPVQTLTLNGSGTVRGLLGPIKPTESPQDLLAELEYQDSNGERLTASAHVTLLPAQVLLGLKLDHWASSQEDLKCQVIAVDAQGHPMAQVPVVVDMLQRLTYSHRERLIGGFYAYEHHEEIKRLQEFCSGTTDAQGRLTCAGRSPVSGNVILQARAVDAQNRATFAHTEGWVSKNGPLWFDVNQHNRMDLIPEKKRYEPGEEAILQARMPFPKATVLVTVERDGIMDSFVQTLTSDAPVLRIPVQGRYAPNMFVSALAVRGRSTEVAPTAMIDLGRPAFRLGYAQIEVGWKAHTLKVQVTTDHPTYKVRGSALATVKVATATGQTLPADAEVALAAVDEGLLELRDNDSWHLLAAMLQKRPLRVTTATAQEQVIGRRHYGRKAVTHGGGGGRGLSGRQLLETLLLWQGRVKLDARGEARIPIPLNDALSSFRVVAVADAGADLFGTGSTSFRTTQDLILFSGLPPLVREQDAFRAGFTVRNGSERPLQAKVTAFVAGTPPPSSRKGEEAPKTSLPPLPTLLFDLAPGESREATWEVTVPADIQRLAWTIQAHADKADDRLSVTQEVIPTLPVRVVQATLQQLTEPWLLPVNKPADALPGRGGVEVAVQPRMTSNLTGVQEYMSRYPFTCLEQRASRAIALQDRAAWDQLMAALPAYLDRDGLVKYFPLLSHGSDALTAYLLAIAHETGWPIPAEALKKMRSGLLRFAQGRILHAARHMAADTTLRKLAALAALSRHEEISPTLLTSIPVEPDLWPTSAVIDWLEILQRVNTLPQRDRLRKETLEILRARLHFQGTTLGFSTESADHLWWLMVSGDSNANRLILGVLNDPGWSADLPRLMRGSLGRQIQGRWRTTTANAWGVVTMKKFAEKFEKDPVTGSTTGQMAEATLNLDWGRQPQGGALAFPWPSGTGQLALRHQGAGKPWVTVQSRAAIPLREPLNSGYHMRRTLTPVERKTDGIWSQGDVVRVRLEVEAQSDMAWVVISDPIPSGGAILGTGLGRDSAIMTHGEKQSGWLGPVFEERTHDAFRAYYDWLPKGNWSMEYTLRLNNPGRFALPPARVEAMYAPEMFGEMPLEAITVAP